ncbi:MAG: type I-MYXAN CRISPR-associated protein Cas5/Cmx5/DevS [bacterium]|nr:type I-MYXAN CRISPR-associated protein Cas5/Cmx5/DevS [bacterium]
MIGIHVTVPIACWRRGKAREYLETEILPPPSTCYGFLLSLVGETDRRVHIGSRLTIAMIAREPQSSVVLRTVWRVKKKPLGTPANARPDYQQILTGNELVIWLDSSEEQGSNDLTLERRVQMALDPHTRNKIVRFGGLSLGESTHLVDEINLFQPQEVDCEYFVVNEQGQITLPVWVDHVGSAATRFVTGNLDRRSARMPQVNEMARIAP